MPSDVPTTRMLDEIDMQMLATGCLQIVLVSFTPREKGIAYPTEINRFFFRSRLISVSMWITSVTPAPPTASVVGPKADCFSRNKLT